MKLAVLALAVWLLSGGVSVSCKLSTFSLHMSPWVLQEFQKQFLGIYQTLSLPCSLALLLVSSHSYRSAENILSLHHLTDASWCPLIPSWALSVPPGLLAFFLAHLLTCSCRMSVESHHGIGCLSSSVIVTVLSSEENSWVRVLAPSCDVNSPTVVDFMLTWFHWMWSWDLLSQQQQHTIT